jgi:hypothetical protein
MPVSDLAVTCQPALSTARSDHERSFGHRHVGITSGITPRRRESQGMQPETLQLAGSPGCGRTRK